MSDYGSHPTKYENISDKEFYGKFRNDEWRALNEEQRRELLQETVNRSAARRGEVGASEVKFQDMEPSVLGEQSNGTIYLNRDRFVNDVKQINFKGNNISIIDEASNIEAIETVLHEDIHAWEDQVSDGTIKIQDQHLKEEYSSNNFSIVSIGDNLQNNVFGSTYLNGVSQSAKVQGMDYYLYYFQSTERDAHKYSELETMQIIDFMEKEYGNEESFDIYREQVRLTGYEATYNKGATIFDNTNFEQEINTSIMNSYYDTQNPVDPHIDAIVKDEMVASYNYQFGINTMHNEENDSVNAETTGIVGDNAIRETINNEDNIASESSGALIYESFDPFSGLDISSLSNSTSNDEFGVSNSSNNSNDFGGGLL